MLAARYTRFAKGESTDDTTVKCRVDSFQAGQIALLQYDCGQTPYSGERDHRFWLKLIMFLSLDRNLYN